MPSLATFLSEVWRAMRAQPFAATVAIACNLFFIAAGAVVPLLIGLIIETAVPGGSSESLRTVAITWGVIVVIWLGCEWVMPWGAAHVLSTYSHRVRTDALNRIHANPHSRHDSGAMLTRVTSDLDNVELAMLELLIGSITDFGRLIVTCIALTIINPVIGGAFLVFLIGFVVMQRVVAKPADRANDQRQVLVDSMTTKLAETVRTAPVIHAYNLEQWDSGRFAEHSDALRRATRRRTLIGWWPYWVGAFTGQVALLVILVLAAYMAQSGFADVATVAASMVYVQGAVAALLLLAQFLPMAQRAGVSVLRVREFSHDGEASTSTASERTGAADSPTDVDRPSDEAVDIAVQSVSVVAPNGSLIIDDMTVHLPAGKWSTIVGGSGAGKSTVLRLITGELAPTQGRVLIGGLPPGESAVRTSLVFQDSLLFATTIGDNIRAGMQTATDDDVEAAARLAELHEVLEALPDGYATMVDSSGGVMSGGQRQRVALARALVRQPKLLLLDESTSALDPQTATSVWRTMRRVARDQGITVVAVCHQLELAHDSDQIVVLQSGSVVELGSPNDLNRAYGPWRELVDAHHRLADNDAEAIEQLMRAHPDLFPTDHEALADLARTSIVTNADPGDVVCARGQPLDALVLVQSGRLEVNDGSSRYLLGAGSALGNLNDLTSGRVSIDARMETGGQLVLIPRRALLPSLLDLLESQPATAAALAWLARAGSASRHDLSERLGPDGATILDSLIKGGSLRVLDDGSIGVIMGNRRRRSVSDTLDSL